ncbi:cytochrome c3 family protein [Desulfonema magnum]|uniref:Cytochrome c, class III family protein n=1 Tax=Desulfonema magnum TaxID=45655 RepID=A0A975GRM9_9BACT|nr:cytochrome c3 family protein [Desulfonema magnum]QTA91184.1 putative cytochrome c, class III family protein [Desulfonema magnum]
MTSKKELQLAYGLAIVLLLVGILSYTVSSADVPEEPVRMMFQCSTGKVLFDHKTHTAESGYGLACNACHHHPEDSEDSPACRECHVLPADGSAPQICLDCHEADEIEMDSMMKKTDALHQQCIGCHKEQEAGPVECESCHVKYSF